MPLIIGIIILASALIPTYNFVQNKIKNSQPPKIERIQNYTMDQLRLSTLTEKYGNYDYPGETEIEFNGCRYRVIDNKSGGRKFEPKDNCPPLIITPISYERYQKLLNSKITPTPNLVKNQNFNNNNTFNPLNFNLNQTNTVSNNQNSNYVRCHFPHSGVLILKKEECDKLIDCQINDNLWTPLTQEECKKRQEGYIDEAIKKYFDKSNNNQPNYQITPIPTFELNIPTSPPLNYSWQNDIKPTLTDEQKIQCRDEISARYRQRILDMQARLRANGVQRSGYAIQQEKEILDEMYRQIKIQCGIEY